MEVKEFSELHIGWEYIMETPHLGVENWVKVISDDVTSLNRPIFYLQFMERGFPILTKKKLKWKVERNSFLPGVFVLWDFEFATHKFKTV